MRTKKRRQREILACVLQNRFYFFPDFMKLISSSIPIIISKKIAYPSMPAESMKGSTSINMKNKIDAI